MNNEKLIIEHLAPYLPYGLKMLNTKSGRNIDVRGIEIGVNDISILATILDRNYFKDTSYQLSLWPIKPILRPMSDLKGMPEIFSHGILPTYVERLDFDCVSCEYWLMEILFKHHFDVFGLIEKGLAIDINTLGK